MIRKTHKDTYKAVAQKLDIPYDMVELIGNFTWGELAKAMEDFKYREIYMYKLGAFRFRKLKSLEYIEKVKDIKEKMLVMKRPLEYAEKAEIRVKEKVDKMMILIEEWNKIIKDREEFKIRKAQYYVDRDIQKQSSNLGGTQESNI